MAGIGFELQKLVHRDDIFGPARGYLYAAAIVAGPWILTVIAIAVISYWSPYADPFGDLSLFRTITLYNFSISLVASAPVAMITTRFLADRIYDGDERESTGALVGSVLLALGVQLPVPLFLYFVAADIPAGLALLSCANYFAVAALWVAVVFLSTLKDYAPVIFSFVVGLGLSATCAVLLRGFGAEGYVAGFTVGLAITLFMTLGRTIAEFRAELAWPANFLGYFRRFWPLAVAALAYNCAIWIDKWIFWMSPSFAVPISGIPTYPPYDGAMFYAHLTLAPGLAVFFALVETGFYTCYRRFYWYVQNHGTLAEIEAAQQELEANAAAGLRLLLAIHLAVAVAALLLAPLIAEALSLMPMQIGIFRFAVVGTAAHGFFLYAIILLAYFDLRRRVLVLSSLFLVLNAIFTLASQYVGYSYFGAGYFLAAVLSAAVAFTLAQREMSRLRYLTFIGNNPATGRSL